MKPIDYFFEHLARNEAIHRRTMLRMSGMFAAMAVGCSTTSEAVPDKPVVYPKSSGKKIQPPVTGCYTGIFTSTSPEAEIPLYESLIGKKPSFFLQKYRNVNTMTSITEGIYLGALLEFEKSLIQGVIPFITYDARVGLSSKSDLKGIQKGDYDRKIVKAAKDLRKLCEEYDSGFFIRTMREMNHRAYSWSGSSKAFKKTWKHLWNIFEQEGTNEYATWVFNPYVGFGNGIGTSYFPGEEYVDWVGFNGYNFSSQSWGSYEGFTGLFKRASQLSLKHYGLIPQIIVESGMSESSDKPRWIKKSYDSLRAKMQNLKGVGVWSTKWSFSNVSDFDGRINSSSETLAAYREALAHPYYLGARK